MIVWIISCRKNVFLKFIIIFDLLFFLFYFKLMFPCLFFLKSITHIFILWRFLLIKIWKYHICTWIYIKFLLGLIWLSSQCLICQISIFFSLAHLSIKIKRLICRILIKIIVIISNLLWLWWSSFVSLCLYVLFLDSLFWLLQKISFWSGLLIWQLLI